MLYKDVPKPGRYDLLFFDVGKHPDEAGTYVFIWMIDNGEYKGKKVSEAVSGERGYEMKENLKERKKQYRRSAYVEVECQIKVGGQWTMHDATEPPPPDTKAVYKYHLRDWDVPDNKSQLIHIYNENRFNRGKNT